MTDINISFVADMAELAEASYANLLLTKDLFDELQNSDFNDMKFSETQATAFVQNWDVVAHRENTNAGFSATLFEGDGANASAGYVFAIRGTEPSTVGDLVTDLQAIEGGVAINQILDMYNYWKYLTTPVGAIYQVAKLISGGNDLIFDGEGYTIVFENSNTYYQSPSNVQYAYGSGRISSDTQVTVTGHSLGGHLAAAFSRLFSGNTKNAVLINSLGFGDQAETTDINNVSKVFSILGGQSSFNEEKIQNYAGTAGPDGATGFSQPAPIIPAYTEIGGIDTVLGHSATQMTDALKLAALFYKIDSGITLEHTNLILSVSHGESAKDFDAALAGIAKLAGLTDMPATFDREKYYEFLYKPEIQNLINNTNLTIDVFLNATQSQLISLAQSSIAYRYALANGSVYALQGDDSLFNQFNENGELNLDVTDNNGNLIGHQLTEQYLQDRAAYLVAIMQQAVGEDPSIGTTSYKDLTTNTVITNIENNSIPFEGNNIVFGKFDEENTIGFAEGVTNYENISDRIYGGTKNDQIWGLAGSDTLIGGLGDDTLLGGEGTDTYVWNAGDGNDVIYDDKAKLILNGEVVTGLTRVGGFVSYDITTYPAGVDVFSWSTTVDGQAQTYLFYFFRQADTTDKFIVKIYTQDQVVDLTNPEESTSATEVLTLFEFDPVASGLFTEVQMNGFSTIGSNAGMAVQDSLISDAHTDDFFGGAVVDKQHYTANTLLSGSIGDDHLYGMPISELYGDFRPSYVLETIDPINPAETYTILGQALDGNDTLNGGAGNDILLGGYGGNDTFIFDAGFGWDIIADMNHSLMMRSGDADTVIFKNQSADDFSFWRFNSTQNAAVLGVTPYSDLLVTNNKTGERIIVKGYFVTNWQSDSSGDEYTHTNSNGGVDSFIFQNANGAVTATLTYTEIEGLITVPTLDNWPIFGNIEAVSLDYFPEYIPDSTVSGTIPAFIPVSDVSAARLLPNLNTATPNSTPSIPTMDLEGNFQYDSTSYRSEQFTNGNGQIVVGFSINEFSQVGDSSRDVLRMGAYSQGTLDGLGGNDTLYASRYSDTILGGNGNDVIVDHTTPQATSFRWVNVNNSVYNVTNIWNPDGSYAYPNILMVETFGNGSSYYNTDLLLGGSGDDRFFISNTVHAEADGGDGYDTVYFSSADAKTGIKSTENLFYNVEHLIGTDQEDILNSPQILTTGMNPYLIPAPGTLNGAGGNDTLGGDGDDILFGDAGDDVLFGVGSDELHGGTGNDLLFSGVGGTSFGDGGDDVLIGNANNELLYGGTGNDILVADASLIDVPDNRADHTKLDNNSNSQLSQIVIDRENLLINNSVTIDGYAKPDGDRYAIRLNAGETVTVFNENNFSNDEWGTPQINTTIFVQPSSGMGYSTSDRSFEYIYAENADPNSQTITFTAQESGWYYVRVSSARQEGWVGGYDANIPSPGNQYYEKYVGSYQLNISIDNVVDDVEPADGIDIFALPETAFHVIAGTNGNDNLPVPALGSTLVGGADNDTILGGKSNDTLIGDEGNDTLNGWSGDDILVGGTGADVYVFGRGSGHDVVESDQIQNVTDKVKLINVTDNEIGVTRINDNLVLVIQDTGETLTIQNWFLGEQYQIESFEFEGSNTTLSNVQIGTMLQDASQFWINNSDYTLYGLGGNDVLVGNDQANVLDGGIGDDTLDGALGADTLIGGMGNDTYVFGLGYGHDIVKELNGQSSTADTLLFGEGISPSDIAVIQSGNDLVITIQNTSDSLTFENWFNGADYKIDFVKFADETNWSGAELESHIPVVQNIIANNATLTGGAANDTLTADGFNNHLFGYGGNDQLTVAGYNNTLWGGADNDVLTSNGILTTLYGETGNDTLISNDWGNKLFGGDDNDVLTVNGDINTLDGGAGDDIFTVFVGVANSVVGGAGNDTIIGTDNSGFSYIDGGADIDTYDASGVIAGIVANIQAGMVSNIAGGLDFISNIEKIIGTNHNDQFTGITYNNITLQGGLGNDTYEVSSTNTVLIEESGEGDDLILANMSYMLSDSIHVENLTLTGAAIIGTGNSFNNVITGNEQNNTLTGIYGNDTIYGNGGHDVIVVSRGDAYVDGGAGDDIIMWEHSRGRFEDHDTFLGGSGNDTIYTGDLGDSFVDGGDDDDTLISIGEDVLIGGAGADSITAESSDNQVVSYQTANSGVIVDLNDQGIAQAAGDDINSDAYGDVITGIYNITGSEHNDVLTANTEYASILLGLAGSDILIGSDSNDTLDGGVGVDILTGGTGDDIYFVDNASDQIVEDDTLDIDTVVSSANYSLAANVENLTLIGSAVIGVGNNLNNIIAGNDQDNILEGGAGDDTYFVDNANDQIDEDDTSDIDTVISSANYSLAVTANNVENLTLVNEAVIGVGNNLNNIITGNDQNNVLEGGLGTDTLIGGLGIDAFTGGAGDDTYFVDNTGEQIFEEDISDIDTVVSSVDYSLAATADNVENLTLAGSAVVGIGNDLNNIITGIQEYINEEQPNYWLGNTLDGGLGADTLIGGANVDVLIGGEGNDVYIFNFSGYDIVVEENSEDIDTIISAVYYTPLADNVENLTLIDGAVVGVGNNADNIITGNNQDNILEGGEGGDILQGGEGSDIYVFGRGMGQDTITDYDANYSDSDVLSFASDTSVNYDQLWFAQSGDNLEISIIGTNDKVSITDWFTQGLSEAPVAQIEAGGKVLLDSEVQALVDAMASLTAPALGQTELSQQSYYDNLSAILASNWS